MSHDKQEHSEGIDDSTLKMLECAFSEGPSLPEYLPLIYALKDHMSFRGVAIAVGALIGKDYAEVLTDVYHATSEVYIPDPSVLRSVKEKLDNCGYQAWLKEE